MKKIVNWGVVGLGKIAHKFAKDIAFAPGNRLIAAGSSSLERAIDFCNVYDIQYPMGSYEEVYSSGDVDAVYVATTHSAHYQCTLDALAHGKHVLCEKPFAMNFPQAEEMVQTARQKNLFLMEALWTRFFPCYKEARSEIHNGKLGFPLEIKADFGFKAAFDPEKRIFNKRLGGGALLDVGIYPIFLALDILGKPDKISARGHIGKTGVDEACNVRFTYNEGHIADLECSIVSQTPVEAKISGPKGQLRMHSKWHKPTSLEWEMKDDIGYIKQYPKEGSGFEYEIRQCYQCIQNRQTESPEMPLDLTLLIAATLDQIRNEIGLVYDEDLK